MLRCATPRCPWSPPSMAWRWAAAVSWPCIRQARGGHGKLHRPGGSGRGPGARRRRPDLHRPPRAENMAASSKDILPFLTEGFTAAPWPRWAPAPSGIAQAGLPAGQRRHRAAQGRAAVRRHQRSQVHGRQWLARTAQAPVPRGGPQRLATIKAQLVNMRDGGFISAYDFNIGAMIAEVVCGGDVDAGSMVSEEYLHGAGAQGVLPPDRPAQDAQERIMGMLSTGKPVVIDDAALATVIRVGLAPILTHSVPGGSEPAAPRFLMGQRAGSLCCDAVNRAPGNRRLPAPSSARWTWCPAFMRASCCAAPCPSPARRAPLTPSGWTIWPASAACRTISGACTPGHEPAGRNGHRHGGGHERA